MEKKAVTTNILHIFKEIDIQIPRKKISTLYKDTLQQQHSLTIIFISNQHSKTLNRYRGKNKPTDILTFPAHSDTSPAEIYINADMVRKNAKESGIPVSHCIMFLAIHGILHLLGYQHNDDMEKMEDTYAARYMYTE